MTSTLRGMQTMWVVFRARSGNRDYMAWCRPGVDGDPGFSEVVLFEFRDGASPADIDPAANVTLTEFMFTVTAPAVTDTDVGFVDVPDAGDDAVPWQGEPV